MLARWDHGRRIVCEGCGNAVEVVDQASSEKLSRLEHLRVRMCAFECTRCEAIIFERELIDGRFIPPQFAQLRSSAKSHTMKGISADELNGHGSGMLKTLSISQIGR